MGKIAGSFDPINGKIYNPISNMQEGKNDDYSTHIHEIQHANFQNITVLGNTIKILMIEWAASPEKDVDHKKEIKILIEILCKSFCVLQEIYANSMELLWIEKYQGKRQAEEVYKRKTRKYQEFGSYFRSLSGENERL